MATHVLYGRINDEGGLVVASHGSCFGSISSLYRGIHRDKSYDRRVLVSTNFNGKCARIWAETFKKAYPNGLTVTHKGVVQQIPLPRIKYYGVDHKSLGINAEMNTKCKTNGSSGYWQLTMPATVTEYAAYVFIKLFCKTGSMPNFLTQHLEAALLFFQKELGDDWRQLLVAMGAHGATQSYSFPIGRGTSAIKDSLVKYLKGTHEVSDQGTGSLFGQPLPKGTQYREVGTMVQVMPNLWSYNNTGENTISFPSSGDRGQVARIIQGLMKE
ncbi:hypothetical protein FDJ32_gp14 [Pseudomonas phage NV1]|uniref:Uncharacterized protein n=1 Tax=Pseudomonas phage NV1 TaxID=2079543 RepID=A0A2L0HPK9_9CAUD|nr:hypothetical protein FDJ32_gp14 [Pseudomonas phage NV1]AUX83643.1 hypothetical protein NV1_p14 [Pseudomonas phage NV1]